MSDPNIWITTDIACHSSCRGNAWKEHGREVSVIMGAGDVMGSKESHDKKHRLETNQKIAPTMNLPPGANKMQAKLLLVYNML